MLCFTLSLGELRANGTPNFADCIAEETDLVIYGATPAGIAAAVNAADEGMAVVLIESYPMIGGLMTGGLSYTDYHSLKTLGGFFGEYMALVRDHYQNQYGKESAQWKACFSGTHAEPKVTLMIFSDMIKKRKNITLYTNNELLSVASALPLNGQRNIKSISLVNKETDQQRCIRGKIFIDATYEGDLAAFAGAAYRVGRESHTEFSESYAGKLFYDGGKILPGSTGEGDKRVQGYNFRPIMTRDPSNSVRVTKPTEYNRADYLSLLILFKSGKIKQIFTEDRSGLLRVQYIPNGKADINDIKNAPVRLSLLGKNYQYPEASYSERQPIIEEHRRHVQGLIYFLQNDSTMPKALQDGANEWGLAKDEFLDSNNFPPRLYIREARRIVGSYVFKESDTQPSGQFFRSKVQPNSIAIGDYTLNCHGEQPPGLMPYPDQSEGDFSGYTVPFQLPYGIICPKGFYNLLVPVAVSATHVGFSSIRLEPTWCALGQAAGIAASMSAKQGISVQDVDVASLQRKLHQHQAKTIYLSDVNDSSPYFELAQHFGTGGYFHYLYSTNSYPFQRAEKADYGLQYREIYPYHDVGLDQPMDEQLATDWLRLAQVEPNQIDYTQLNRGQFLEKLYELTEGK